MINEFEYKGKKYVRIDFNNQYTFEQADLFEEIGKRVTDVALFLKGQIKSKKKDEIGLGLKIKEMLHTSKVMPELLAHVWYNEEDSEFNPVTYKERVEMFKKMPIGFREEKNLEEGVSDFLSVAMKSSMGGIQSLLLTPQK